MRKKAPPYLSPAIIKMRIDLLRSKYDILRHYPVDIEKFADCDLKIDIIPESGVRDKVGADAIIVKDFSSIIIDSEYYMAESCQNRVRFSIAHELGHMFLHEKYLAHFSIKTESEWFDFMENIGDSDYSFLEYHANTFAGMILVPEDEILSLHKKGMTFAGMSRYFGVSIKVIEKRMMALYDEGKIK